MNFNLISNTYALICLISIGFIAYLMYSISKSNFETKQELLLVSTIETAIALSYAFFLISNSYLRALYFYNVFYSLTISLSFSIFSFTLAYTNSSKKLRALKFLFALITILDFLYSLSNISFKNSFDLVQNFTSAGFSYWAVIFLAGHKFQVFVFSLNSITSIFLLFYNFLKVPAYFKSKYLALFSAYVFVLFTNLIAHLSRSPLDFSIVIFVILLNIIFYYSVYISPTKLTIKPLLSLNESILDAIMCFDYTGKLIYHNSATESLFNKKGEELEKFAEQFRFFFLEDKSEEISLENNDGEKRHYVTEYKDFRIEDSVIGSYLKLIDKTDAILESQHRVYTASHDSLTGLYNRLGFFEAVQQALKQNIYKQPILLCSNIRDFRLINEIYGERYGDSVLITQAQMMKKYAHHKNINGRLADDKFALLMDKEDFDQEIFEQAFYALRAMTQSGTYSMSISIGIYEIYNRGENVQVMYDKAKMAMDSIKNDYQKIFSFYDSSMMDKLLAEKTIVSDFEQALKSMQFEIYLQPINDLSSKPLGAEALVRWKHPQQKLMQASNFINIFERTGLIYKLDMYVWELAAKKLQDWQSRGFKDFFITVNVSPTDKQHIDVVQYFIELKEKYKINPNNLIIEINEKNFAGAENSSIKNFKSLREAGFKVYIDKFGTGYSSMNMLKDFEADGIKIDTVFLEEDENSKKNKIILQTMISMAEDLNMQVIAEKVETKRHLNILSEMNCKIFQGFYYSKPLPIREFESLYLK
ncbi:EAL domain-containing protein [Treponema pectinovorum]|uniref:EAL domain-containing protein n=1 Tax=Treponema pectinovorum TaxID=164 RepID=UPI0011C81E98|nr:EAL domain-containing protein [Treponema pectinovorum]